MLKTLGRDNLLLTLALVLWAMGEGLWYLNLRQPYLLLLGATPAQAGMAMALESLGHALLLLPAGYAIDRYGPHTVMLASWVLGCVATLVMLLARDWIAFTPGLALYGTAIFAVPALTAYAIMAAPESGGGAGTQRVLGVVFAAYPIGGIASPALGGWLASQFDIRSVLWAAFGLYVASTCIILLTRRVAPVHVWENAQIGAVFRNRLYLQRACFYGLAMAMLWAAINFAPIYLHEMRQLADSDIGPLYTILLIGTAAANLALGRISARWGFVVLMGMGGAGLSAAWLTGEMAILMPGYLMLGAAVGIHALGLAGVERIVRPQDRGMAFALFEMIVALMTAAANQSAGYLYERTPSHDLPFVAGLAGIVVVAIVWYAARLWRAPEADALSVVAQ